MDKVALYPGSFDPFTIAHYEIVQKTLTIFDRVVIAVGYNISKKGFLAPEKRAELIRNVFSEDKRVEVVIYDSLTVTLCAKLNINHIIRGIRSFTDFEIESVNADVNNMLHPDIITMYLTSSKENSSISSSVVREVLKFGGDVTRFLPKGVTTDYLKSLI